MGDRISFRVIDLFCGVGGFSLGAHLAGFETILAIDNDEDITSSFSTNFPGKKATILDLADRESDEAVVKASNGTRVTGILGGPPCQGFSSIGLRDPEDSRNELVRRYFEIVGRLMPKFFVFENVPGILSDSFRVLLDDGLDSLPSRYSILGPMKLDASDFGAATSRTRVFVVGWLGEEMDSIGASEVESLKVSTKATVKDAIFDLPNLEEAQADDSGEYWARHTTRLTARREYARSARMKPPKGLASRRLRGSHRRREISGFAPTFHKADVVERFSGVSPGTRDSVSKCRRLQWDESCPTLRAGTGPDRGSYQAIRPLHPEENRVISVREAARLQGFPDWFQFHPTKWHSFRMIGNSVSPYQSSALLALIRNRIES